MSNHIPGPWVADGLAVWSTIPIRFNATTACTLMVADTLRHKGLDGDRYSPEATARLIALAPEMLALIEDVARGNTEYEDLETEAQRLIAQLKDKPHDK